MGSQLPFQLASPEAVAEEARVYHPKLNRLILSRSDVQIARIQLDLKALSKRARE